MRRAAPMVCARVFVCGDAGICVSHRWFFLCHSGSSLSLDRSCNAMHATSSKSSTNATVDVVDKDGASTSNLAWLSFQGSFQCVVTGTSILLFDPDRKVHARANPV